MKTEIKKAIEFSDFDVFQNHTEHFIPPGFYRALLPTIDQKMEILKFCSDPNFESFYYLLPGVVLNEKGEFVVFEKRFDFLKVSKRNGNHIILDKNNMRILGNGSKPYKLYEPQDNYWKNPEDIIKYVGYNSDGGPIKDSMEFILKEIPNGSSDSSVLLIFQWKYENPSRLGYYVVPKKIKLENLIKKFNSI